MDILDSPDLPRILKTLDRKALDALAARMRERIVAVVGSNGGHLASNLGVVELAIALHRVFDSPRDRIIWDVGHQCYPHKLLTGRAAGFEGIRKEGGISGFPKGTESPHDAFDTGHASTSISAALGIKTALDATGEGGHVIAVIGDGALTGGLAFEGLSCAGNAQRPLIIVLNDNKMSIAPNVAGLSRYLSRLTATTRYQRFRSYVDRALKSSPRVGQAIYRAIARAKKAVKAVFFKETLFSELGFEYAGPFDGHDVTELCRAFRQVRDLAVPVVVHVLTRKGRGYGKAERDPARYHGVSPFDVEEGLGEGGRDGSFTEAFSAALAREGWKDRRVHAVTAAMAKGTGLHAFQVAYPERFHDAGIAEGHAVAFAAGLAKGGLRPVAAIYSTFMQRAVDQVIHDVCLQGLPVVLCLDRAGFVGDDGETHQGLYDIALFRSAPGLAIVSPASAGELAAALAWALGRNGPAIVRYPKAKAGPELPELAEPIEEGRGVLIGGGAGDILLVVATGGVLPEAIGARELLAAEGVRAEVLHLRFASPVDGAWLLGALGGYRSVLCVEEAVEHGGVSESIAALVAAERPGKPLGILAFRHGMPLQGSRARLLEVAGFSPAGIAAAAKKVLAPALRRAR